MHQQRGKLMQRDAVMPTVSQWTCFVVRPKHGVAETTEQAHHGQVEFAMAAMACRVDQPTGARSVDDPIAGRFHVPGFPIKFSAADPEPDLVAPTMGQHNREVLSELLGYDDAALDAWEQQGLLGSKDR